MTAKFLAEVLDPPAPRRLGHFTALRVGETPVALVEVDRSISTRHSAFLVSEPEIDGASRSDSSPQSCPPGRSVQDEARLHQPLRRRATGPVLMA
ncbi:hypothetical protein G5B40_04820 [Pikeienuella piscinae]|uniref:Uncharacterized protein n=1 Tax=Pikeienuella piscinae TaxID=2748098 RepID=A0A7L5BX53_9RHOB|nr:hypothetical protein [Pikeienuella piscinae]QIE54826.1 hypothetical protein G5B40_04820 [Pikeienuella piscinae]